MEKSIFEQVWDAASTGVKWHISLKDRTLTINGKKLVDNGKYEGELGCYEYCEITKEQVLKQINEAYSYYKYSIPSERTNSRRKNYFKALKEHELSEEDMLFGIPRDKAQACLEFTVLYYAVTGVFDKYWDEWDMGKWFWQSEEDKDLVILKEWVTRQQ
jgi:hypothetical protein